ncbi:MAG: His/Gly/Thr/Pro-type tRNA ligase C-terminal domain-containing protein, partial [Methanobacterium sp.]|nr:His/Gly/Thr/Pro-type tRNA ligase C-terminal domain-containing protein [Methanobacterium sp.]
GIPYMVSKRPEWDKFPGAEYTVAFDTIMPDGKTLQIGTVHNLGQTFAKTFDIKYETATGEHEYVYQTCYGLSDRVIASVIGVHGDKTGLSLPPDIAPYQVVIVPIIFKKGGEEVIGFCKNLEEKLKLETTLRVYFDNRDIRAGKKYYEWEMKGIPLRIEIGPRDIQNKKIVTYRRDTQEKEVIDYNPSIISESITQILDDIRINMNDNTWAKMENNIRKVNSIKEAKKVIAEYHGIVTFDWCGDKECGKDIEENIKVDILGVQESEKDDSTCINCDKPSKHITLLAKTY